MTLKCVKKAAVINDYNHNSGEQLGFWECLQLEILPWLLKSHVSEFADVGGVLPDGKIALVSGTFQGGGVTVLGIIPKKNIFLVLPCVVQKLS